jgi:ubiquinone/menaquinone biosynthesis C-methylase UbiE
MKRDVWASWLLERRSGGDPDAARCVREGLHPVREKVLDAAGAGPDDRLLDVGCGDGLIAFGALERGVAEVLFTDISQDLLDVCRQLATERGVRDRCRFLRASADDLGEVADGSVNAVTTRSVLIYVEDKAQAFREFHRVLAPGGRMSLFEPINRYFHDADGRMPRPPELEPVEDLVDRLNAVYYVPELAPMLNFGERDLLRMAEEAGFAEVHVRLEVTVKPRRPVRWETALRSAPNPLAPTLEEALERTLTPAEIDRYTSCVRPLLETGAGTMRHAYAYVSAVKATSAGGTTTG